MCNDSNISIFEDMTPDGVCHCPILDLKLHSRFKNQINLLFQKRNWNACLKYTYTGKGIENKTSKDNIFE